MAKKKDNRTHVLMRYFLISVVICIFAASITVKLFSTTIINADKWNAKANTELSRVDTIRPERGEILACDGNVLATNLRYYTVRLDYRSEKFRKDTLMAYVDELSDSLAKYFTQRDKNGWKEYLTDPLKKPMEKWPRAKLIMRDMSYADLCRLRKFPYFDMRNRNKSGLTIESRLRRRNPYGDMARRSIGAVSEDSITREHHGVSGLEMALDSLLYGKPGLAKQIPLTHNIVSWTDVAPERGYDITTTIDIALQDIVENELNAILEEKNAQWGVAVLMETATGDIKAISNLEKSRYTGRYIEGMNRAVLGFEPGSVVKTLSMMIALEDGIVSSLDENIPTGGSFAYAGGRPITDSHHTTSLRVREVLEHSSNIAMARIITRAYNDNPDAYYKRVEQLGFFEPMNTGIAGERTPRFPKHPSRVTLSRVSYGYATEIPPLSTLALYNAIANDGKYVRPRLVKKLTSEKGDSVLPITYIRDSICSRRTAATMRDLLRQVVEGKHGTARRLDNELVKIAGKTGTSYMVDSGGYNTSKKRLTFCGFFPADNPKYSCIVLVCQPKEGPVGAAATSGMVLKNIAMRMYSRGMLDNASDFAATPNKGVCPTFFATHFPNKYESLTRDLAINKSQHKHFERPAATKRGTVPNVRGLGLHDAITTMEKEGYNVEFTGSGYVTSQTPNGGSPLKAGSKVKIKLSQY